jgi:hypothetical protein
MQGQISPDFFGPNRHPQAVKAGQEGGVIPVVPEGGVVPVVAGIAGGGSSGSSDA